jgi:hypothetical protein
MRTCFQLYHCSFSADYLRQVDVKGEVNGEGVTLGCSPLYDLCNPEQRGIWLDTFIALLEFLRSGESKVGYLNKSMKNNPIHQVLFLLYGRVS